MTLILAAATGRELASALGPAAKAAESGEAVALAGREIVPLATGIGVINAAYSLGRALERIDPRGVVGVGIAGSFDLAAFPLGRVCLAAREVWPEYGVEDGGLADARALGFPLAGLDGREVFHFMELEPEKQAAAMGLRVPGEWPRAVSLTVSTVTATRERAELLVSRHGPDIENMEGFAWALACARAKVPFVQIRAVSNLVGERDKRRWDVKTALAALGPALGELLSQGFPPE